MSEPKRRHLQSKPSTLAACPYWAYSPANTFSGSSSASRRRYHSSASPRASSQGTRSEHGGVVAVGVVERVAHDPAPLTQRARRRGGRERQQSAGGARDHPQGPETRPGPLDPPERQHAGTVRAGRGRCSSSRPAERSRRLRCAPSRPGGSRSRLRDPAGCRDSLNCTAVQLGPFRQLSLKRVCRRGRRDAPAQRRSRWHSQRCVGLERKLDAHEAVGGVGLSVEDISRLAERLRVLQEPWQTTP
jgi:hypothetical protein